MSSTHRTDAEGSIRAARDTLAEIQGQRTTTDITIANAARAHAIATAAAAQAILALADALADVLATPARAQAYRDAAAEMEACQAAADDEERHRHGFLDHESELQGAAVRDMAAHLRKRADAIHPAPKEQQ